MWSLRRRENTLGGMDTEQHCLHTLTKQLKSIHINLYPLTSLHLFCLIQLLTEATGCLHWGEYLKGRLHVFDGCKMSSNRHIFRWRFSMVTQSLAARLMFEYWHCLVDVQMFANSYLDAVKGPTLWHPRWKSGKSVLLQSTWLLLFQILQAFCVYI